MKLLIAVPSKNRPEGLIKNTLRWLTYSKYPWKIFIEPQDTQKYQEALALRSDFKVSDVLVSLDKDNQGLGYAKVSIQKYAEQHGFDVIFKVDDDLKSWRDQRNRNKEKTTRHKWSVSDYGDVFNKLINDGLEALNKYPSVGAIGLAYRNEIWEPQKWSSINARLQTAYMVYTKLFNPPKAEAISVFEDFATYLWVRKCGYDTLRHGLIGIDCEDIGTNNGGHQDFNRYELAKKEAILLQEIYPALRFKIVDKPWKIEPKLTGEFFNVRKL
jgi:hypothetical protein